MSAHKRARLNFARRIEMVKQMTLEGLDAGSRWRSPWRHFADGEGVARAVLSGGEVALADASSRPAHSPEAIDASKARLIVELRQAPDAPIAHRAMRASLRPLSAACWPALAQGRDGASFADFLEKVLVSEQVAREERKRTVLMRLATMPSIKTLEQFD